MSWLEAIILAIVQGLTEFLPVSSSGHLALSQALMKIETGGVFYDVLLHVATMLSVVVVFRRELLALLDARLPGEDGAQARKVVLLIVASFIPTGIIGLSLRGLATTAFDRPAWVGAGLLFTSIALLAVARRTGDEAADGGTALADLATLSPLQATLIGVAQGCAVWPGISRSGSTIACALGLGVAPKTAARFSLMISLPVIAAGFLLEALKLEGLPATWPAQALGAVVAFGVGLLAIRWLLAAVRGRPQLLAYAAYTAILGSLAIFLGSR
ncbi:MAG: undecaprenyl-diphosphate phosphatase [Acidobacteriota bacterium]